MRQLLYGELVSWYVLLDPPEDHRVEVAGYRAVLERAVTGSLETLLELGAGAGNNAVHFKEHARCTLTDLSDDMLGVSRARNPECEHVLGDMRTLRLARTFDAVLVHDAIAYMTTRDDLRAAAETAFLHTRPGGAALFAPDCVRETFQELCELEGGDDGERSLRCVMWTWDPDSDDETYRVDFAFLLRDSSGVRAVHDEHVEGLFARATWHEILTGVGYAVERVAGGVESGRPEELFLCRREP
ncbi:MAG: class I SAM-dependent methyltransferase [Vicinamibacterales bacterium]